MSRRKKKTQTVNADSVSTVTTHASRFEILSVFAVIGFCTLMAYFPALEGGFIWDDNAHITKPDLRTLGGLYRIWFDLGATQQYYPLLHSAFWVEHKLWGDATFGYHLVNVLLHVTAATLVYAILTKLRIPGAILAAAIFALHPVHVESVAWISEQKNTLSAVFFLGALLAYLRFDENRAQSAYFTALGLFVLGLLTKTVTATLPAALLVIFWWQRGSIFWRRDVLPLLPFFALGGAAGLFTAWVERTLIGAEGSEFAMTFFERGLLAGRVPWFYLSKLFWPTNLTFIYPRWDVEPAEWRQWAFPLATLATLLLLWALRSRWRGPLAGWLLFVGTLFPVLGFLNIYPFKYSFVADHFQYLASLGILVVVAAGAALALARLPHSIRAAAWGAGVLVVSMLALLTWRQAHLFADVFKLYQATIDRNPNCWLAHNNLGWAYAEAKRPREAIAYYERAIQLRPGYAETYCHMGTALVLLGQTQEGMASFRRAIELRPDYGEAYNNLASTFKLIGEPREALENYRHAALWMPRNAIAQFNYGDALLEAGKPDEAIVHFERAIEWQPDNAEVHQRLAQALLDSGQAERAADEAASALQLAPNSVATHNIRGAALGQLGRYHDALEHFEMVLRLEPQFAQAQSNLMFAYAALQRRDEAIEMGERALRQARANGEKALAERIDNWLTRYRSPSAERPADTPLAPKEQSAPQP